ncbi:MAG: hypothetical protein J1F38_05805 [Muribaculaceae bacterium]|nr:hypothetical protein [Muribaculaceae bacterium]
MTAKLSGEQLEKRRKQVEATSTFGLILICVALVAPFTTVSSIEYLNVFRWIYGAGALIYLLARIVDVSDPKESLRLKRLRRMELWAGISFGLATAFWFIGQHKYHNDPYIGILAVLWNTIMFTLVGALIQIVATWLIYSQTKKEIKNRDNRQENK